MNFQLYVVFGLFASVSRCGAIVGEDCSFLDQVANSLFKLMETISNLCFSVYCERESNSSMLFMLVVLKIPLKSDLEVLSQSEDCMNRKKANKVTKKIRLY